MFTAPYTVICNDIKTEHAFIADVAKQYMNSVEDIEVIDANGIIIPLDILKELV